MYIRLTRDQTLVSGFPANDHSREIKTLGKPKETGLSLANKLQGPTER